MSNVRKNAKVLHQNRCRGVSLVISMCACAALLGLSMGLLFSASVLLSRAQRNAARERCFFLADSFAAVLHQELTEPTFKTGTFAQCINDYLDRWDGISSLTAAAEADNTAITVTVKPFSAEAPQARGGSFSYQDSADAMSRLRTESFFVRFRFSVETTAEQNEAHYICTDSYCRRDRFALHCYWGDTPVFWDGAAWYLDQDYTRPFAPPEETAADARITYICDPDEILSTEFLPAVKEGGGLV